MQNRVPIAAGLDVFVVVVFVAIGRRNHDENPGIGGLLGTAAPFLIALVLAWAAARAWREPWSWPTGVIVWVGTIAAGMLLRHFVFDDGTALSFVIVATVFLGTFLNGWRAIARGIVGRTAHAGAS